LVSYIKDGIKQLSFPKGKPNIGETIGDAAFREVSVQELSYV
jgi:ADP-ribose pyrophosphatase YjhB (NUDIX family)